MSALDECPFDSFDDDDSERPVTCRYCGTRELFWIETPDGVRLHDCDGKPHTCTFSNDVLKALRALP
jgi:DNA-directed RNA polymerase subunit RPC12/RpoP